MAKLPTVQSLGPRPTPRSQRDVIAFRAGIAETTAAEGHRRLSNEAGKLVDMAEGGLKKAVAKNKREADQQPQQEKEAAAKRDRSELAAAKSDVLTRKVELDASFDKDEDHATYSERYGTAMDIIMADAGSRFTNPEVAERFQQSMAPAIASGVIGIGRMAEGRRVEAGLANLQGIMETNLKAAHGTDPMTAGDLLEATQGAIQTARDDGIINEAEAIRLEKNAATSHSLSRLSTMDPKARLADLQAEDGYSQFVDPAVREAMIKDTEQDIATEEREAELQRQQAQTEASAQRERDVREGKTSRAELVRKKEAGELDDAELNKLSALLVAHQEQVEDTQIAMLRVENGWNGNGPPLIPGNEKDQADIDTYYDARLKEIWAELNPADRVITIGEFIQETGFVPQGLLHQIRSGMAGDDVGGYAEMAALINGLRNKDRLIWRKIDEPLRVRARHIDILMRSGVSAEDAVAKSIKFRDMTEQERKGFEAQIILWDHFKSNAEFLEENSREFLLFGGSFFPPQVIKSSSPISRLQGGIANHARVPENLVFAFNALQAEYFQLTGDLEASQQAAWVETQDTWRVTTVGAKRYWMQFPAELMYARSGKTPQENGEWITEQLVTFMRKDSMFDETLGPLKDRVILIYDPSTSVRDKPWYKIRFKSRDGIYLPFTDANGEEVSWAPDWESSPAHQREIAKREEREQKYRDDFDVGRKNYMQRQLELSASEARKELGVGATKEQNEAWLEKQNEKRAE